MDTHRTERWFGPKQSASFRVDTANGRLKSTRANNITIATDTSDQIYQPLDIIGTARGGDGGLPTDGAIGRIDTDETSGQARHQRIADGQ